MCNVLILKKLTRRNSENLIQVGSSKIENLSVVITMKRGRFLYKLIYVHFSIISFYSSLQLMIKPKVHSISSTMLANNLPPIHAAPPESRTRLLPPLLQKSEALLKNKANVSNSILHSNTNNVRSRFMYEQFLYEFS
jgi:hypothetical protein